MTSGTADPAQECNAQGRGSARQPWQRTGYGQVPGHETSHCHEQKMQPSPAVSEKEARFGSIFGLTEIRKSK